MLKPNLPRSMIDRSRQGRCRCSFDRVLWEDYNDRARGLVRRNSCNQPGGCYGDPVGSEFEPEWSRGLARTDGLRLAGSQTLSSIIGNGSVDNSAAIDAFPCIKHEKEVREPLQHHHSLAFRTFH